MPNKDSFTFSDKLKKSKSLPLSKRIPSKVGGDGKAKRTLIQRAQRDLPFIIVAAAALLLLPILSRNSGTDDVGTETPMDFVAPDTSVSDSGSVDREPFPSGGFKNPLDYIVSRSGKDTEETRDGINAGEEGEGYGETTTPPYTSADKEGSATSTYGPAAKGAVRNALVRKATQISALRNSKTMAAGASTGVSRSLATGSAASSGGASGPRVGTRPVALQPMASAGKGGRSETGEGLYAEAARSLGAMNRAGSKQALFDAQLKNVDGTPLSSIGGGPNFGSGAGKLGAGGAPTNNVGYKPYLPWWWDFEKQKAMKKWELWDYNFQKALSDNIIKVGTSLALCLTTGSAEGKVDKFLGDPGGNPDYICKGAENTVMSWADYRDNAPKTESGSSDNKESRTSASYADWLAECKEAGGKKEVSSSDRKNMLDVRLRCLGLKYKKSGLYKWLQKAAYSDKYNCVGVGAGSGIVKFELTSSKESKNKFMGHYVVAKNMADEKASETVIYVAKGGTLDGNNLKARIAQLNSLDKKSDYVVTKVIGFTFDDESVADDAATKFLTGDPDKKGEKIKGINSMNEKEREDYAKSGIKGKISSLQSDIKDINDKSKKEPLSEEDKAALEAMTKELNAFSELPADKQQEQIINEKIAKIQARKEKIESKISNASEYKYGKKFGATTDSVVKRIDDDAASGKYLAESYVQKSLEAKVQKTCSISGNFLGTQFSKMQHTIRGSSANPITCGEPFTYVRIKDPRDFSATITKPGACTYAVVVEKSPISKDKYIVKHVVDFQNGYNSKQIIDNGDGSKTFKFDISVGFDESSSIATPVAENSNGNGWVIWITNSECEGVSVSPNDELPNPDPSNVINAFSAGKQKHDVCQYRWACETGGCAEEKSTTKEYCRKITSGKLEEPKAATYDVYEAVPLGGKLSAAKGKAIATGVNGSVKGITLKSSFGEMGWFKTFLEKSKGNDEETLCMDCFIGGIPNVCTDVCVGADGKINIKTGTEFKPAVPELDKKDFPTLTDEDCPACKKPEVTNEPTPERCTITVSGQFGPARYTLNADLKADIKKQAKDFYDKCVKNLNSESKVDIFVQGFTSFSGEEKDNTSKNVCAIGDKECENKQAQSLGARNILLSEDRAVSVGAEFIKQLKVNMSADKERNRKVIMSALLFESQEAKRDNPSDTFTIKPRTSAQIKSVINSSFYTIAENATLFGQDPTTASEAKSTLTLVFNVYGYGAMGASEIENESERFVRVSTERSFSRIKN